MGPEFECRKHIYASFNGINFILQGEGGGYDDFFGDGSDGALNTSGNVTFPVTAHTGLIVKQYSSITINAGHIVTVNSPCRGLVLYSQGNVTINGTIDMSKKAGFSVGEIPPILITNSKLYKYNRLATIFTSLKGGAGGKGGYGGGGRATSYRSPGGLGGGGRLFAGGYGGGGGRLLQNDYQSQQNGGNGGTVDYNDLGGGKSSGVWSYGRDDQSISLQGNNGIHGGGGSGGAYAIPRRTSSYSRTGDGGICFGGGGGGSGGCSVYDGNSSDAGNGEFAGGFILIVSGGNINIGSKGKLLANGGNGGDGSAGAGGDSSSCWGDGGGGGGGGGGGVVALFYKQSYTNSGSISVSGGLGGSGGASGKVGGDSGGSGTSGSIGTVYTEKLV